MADPYVAEIRIFPFNFAPTGWALCDGQIMPISQNTALFALLGTVYGGDGKSTYGLPNLQGSAPMFWGQGPGLSLHDLGEVGGSDTVTLLESDMPSHAHAVLTVPNPAVDPAPSPSEGLARTRNAQGFQTNSTQNLLPMSPAMIGVAGGSGPHNNLMPYLTLNFCISLQGIFPPRS